MSNIILWLLTLALIALVIYGLIDVFRGASTKPRPPIDATGWTLLVDGSNFAHRGSDVQLAHLEEVLDELARRFQNADLRVFCDANLRYKFDDGDRKEFEQLLQRAPSNTTYVETHGKEADEVLLKYADKHDKCVVVSNDRFGKGDEIELRLDVPLLRVEIMANGVRLADRVHIYKDPERAASVAVDDIVRG